MAGIVLECTRLYFRLPKVSMEIPNILTFLPCLITFSVVKLFNGLRSRIRVLMPYVLNRAGYVYREGEGSTGPSRGEHRLTVYRAHASRASIGLSKKCDFWIRK